MKEFLTFSQLGQWTLHKALKPPKDDYTLNGKDFKVFGGSTLTGELHEDRGTKGTIRGFGGQGKPKARRTNWSNVGKPHRTEESVYNERNPGVGD